MAIAVAGGADSGKVREKDNFITNEDNLTNTNPRKHFVRH